MDNNITIDDVCKYISKCNERDLYFAQKAIEFNKEKLKVRNNRQMFEGPINL
jgi:hypothetical protein